MNAIHVLHLEHFSSGEAAMLTWSLVATILIPASLLVLAIMQNGRRHPSPSPADR